TTLTNWVFQGLVWRSSPISSNRRMRTRLYGGVAGERGINIPRPYADFPIRIAGLTPEPPEGNPMETATIPQTTTGAQLLIDILQRHGVRVLCGIPGGNILPFYDALYGSPLRHILARHEQAAAFMAQGMARASGKLGVCVATSGPGATNLLTGIADAWRDSIPLLAITGQVPFSMIGTQAFQEIDIVSMVRPCAKACFAIQSVEEIAPMVHEAIQIATRGRPGPVLIDIPKELFSSESSVPVFPSTIQESSKAPIPSPQALQQADSLLHEAKRPLLYIGGGVVQANAAVELRSFCERMEIPTVSTLMGLGALPSDHPQLLGMIGMHGHPAANIAVNHCDLLLVIGARFDDRATGALQKFAPQARVIHVDIDAQEIGRLRSVDCALPGDARETLMRLCAGSRCLCPSAWRQEIEILKREFPLPENTAHQLIRDIAEAAGEDCLVATDVGQHQMWTAQAFPFRHPRQLLTSGGLGTMGFGLPTAIGAALARPEKTVLCLSGDGSLLMNLQELATLAELDLPVKICVFQNGGLGMVRQQQTLFFDQRYQACDFMRVPNFCAIAEGFGIPALHADPATPEIWQSSFWSPGPALLEFSLNPEEMVAPMVPTGKGLTEMILL
ncbi:MAG TPA: biosynthetic-type acetolactate synthase large subunit, partial [Fibrobacteraceae bacterium]|nr:biosynthetic-type acetolactate synthase large subunit [Fibrobacteraceae bacterium]